MCNHTLCRKKSANIIWKVDFRQIISCVKLIVSGVIFYRSSTLFEKWLAAFDILFLTLPTHYLSPPFLLTFKFRCWDKFIKILKYLMEIHMLTGKLLNASNCRENQHMKTRRALFCYSIWNRQILRCERVFVGWKLILYRIPTCFSWHNFCERRTTAKNVYAKQFLSFYRNSSIEN